MCRIVTTGSLLQGSFSPIFTNFLNLLIDKRRVNLIGAIVEEFEAIYCDITDTQASGPLFIFAFYPARSGLARSCFRSSWPRRSMGFGALSASTDHHCGCLGS